MLDRHTLGTVADKPHTALRDHTGKLLWEECFTRRGFDGAYTIAYHQHPPMEDVSFAPTTARGWPRPELVGVAYQRRLFTTPKMAMEGRPLDARRVLLSNDDVHVGVMAPSQDDDAFLANNDGDDLYYLHQGSAELQSPLGNLAVGTGDYVWVPRSLPTRFTQVHGPCLWLHVEARRGLHIPTQYLNAFGQLKMDAPYSHRDFRRPGALAQDDAPSTVVIKRGGAFWQRQMKHSVLDVVGWDGFVYPLAFAIERFQPKTGQVHLPPTIHGTFAAGGALVCSFVPRLVDSHPQAIPCPYPHSSVDVDEVIFYCRGNFTSRKGVGPGSLSLHPAGVPHGPHPGAYEASMGTTRTEELAVMLDCDKPLHATVDAQGVEEAAYHASWRATSPD